MHAASVDPEPGSNSPNVCTALRLHMIVRGFDRSHIRFSGSLPLFSCQGSARSEACGHAPTQNLKYPAFELGCQTTRPGRGTLEVPAPHPAGGASTANGRARPSGGQTPGTGPGDEP